MDRVLHDQPLKLVRDERTRLGPDVPRIGLPHKKIGEEKDVRLAMPQKCPLNLSARPGRPDQLPTRRYVPIRLERDHVQPRCVVQMSHFSLGVTLPPPVSSGSTHRHERYPRPTPQNEPPPPTPLPAPVTHHS